MLTLNWEGSLIGVDIQYFIALQKLQSLFSCQSFFCPFSFDIISSGFLRVIFICWTLMRNTFISWVSFTEGKNSQLGSWSLIFLRKKQKTLTFTACHKWVYNSIPGHFLIWNRILPFEYNFNEKSCLTCSLRIMLSSSCFSFALREASNLKSCDDISSNCFWWVDLRWLISDL